MMDWRKLPKVCKPKHGQANWKGYRWVTLWQPPLTAGLMGGAQDWYAIGKTTYAGPLRCTIYADNILASWRYEGGLSRRHLRCGPYMVAAWHRPGTVSLLGDITGSASLLETQPEYLNRRRM